MKKVFIFTISLFICFLISSISSSSKTFAQFGGVLVYPNFVELDFSKSKRKFLSKVVFVDNPTDKTIRVRAYTEAWTMNETGSILFPKEADEHSLNEYLKFNPREFDLDPGKRQTVRLTAKLPEGLDGEFKSIIFFEVINSKKDLTKKHKGVTLAVTFKTRFGVAIYAYKGDITKTNNLKNISFTAKDNKNYLIITVENTGNIHTNFTGELTLTDKNNGNPLVQKLTKFTVLPNKTQQKYVQLQVPDLTLNEYDAQLRLNYEDLDGKIKILEGTTTFKPEIIGTFKQDDLQKPLIEPDVKMTPENIAKPIEVDTTEIKLKPEAN